MFPRQACAVILISAFAAAPAIARVSDRDRDYLNEFAGAGMTEVAAGKLAAGRSRDPDVRGFANQMVRDHGKNNEALKALARRKGVSLPPGLPPDSRDKMAHLRNERGHDFDQEYIHEFGAKGHRDALDLFNDAAQNADDPDVRAFARKTLPTIQHHSDMAEDLDDRFGNRAGDDHGRWRRDPDPRSGDSRGMDSRPPMDGPRPPMDDHR